MNTWGRSIGMVQEDYFTIMGPCHAEEVATEKLSYLTFSGLDIDTTKDIATYFTTRVI